MVGEGVPAGPLGDVEMIEAGGDLGENGIGCGHRYPYSRMGVSRRASHDLLQTHFLVSDIVSEARVSRICHTLFESNQE